MWRPSAGSASSASTAGSTAAPIPTAAGRWAAASTADKRSTSKPYADQGPDRIPDTVTDRQALFVGDILATGYWAADISEIRTGDTVPIIGGSMDAGGGAMGVGHGITSIENDVRGRWLKTTYLNERFRGQASVYPLAQQSCAPEVDGK